MRKLKEFVIEKLILISRLGSIFFVILIFLFLLKEGLAVFKTVGLFKFLFGKNWYPISDPERFGILPLILGSLVVTLAAVVISVPLGVACAIYIAEVAPAGHPGFDVKLAGSHGPQITGTHFHHPVRQT